MTASEQYLHEIDKAMRELYGVTVTPKALRVHDTRQECVTKRKPIRLPGGCLLYRLAIKGTAA